MPAETGSEMSWADTADTIAAEQGNAAAISFLCAEAERDPASGQRSFDIAMRLKAQGAREAAVSVLAGLVERGPQAMRFHSRLERATCLRLLGRADEAAAQLDIARAEDPGSHWPIDGLVEIALEAGQPEQALGLMVAGYDGLRPDGKAEIARRMAEIQARAGFERSLGGAGSRTPRHPGRVAALATAGLMMMVKDEEDILAANLVHHYRLGFRCFCILDNASGDGTAAQITSFRDQHPDALVLSVFDQIVGYYQSDKMAVFQDALYRYAQIAGIALEWMFFIDADEFIAFAGDDDAAGCDGLEATLRDPAAVLLVLHWINAASPEILGSLPPDTDPFAVFTRRVSRLEPVAPMMGNHFVAAYDLPLGSVRVLASDGWFMMHFPLRSLQHVRAKIVNGGRAFRDSKGLETHGGHWRQRYEQYLAHGDAMLRTILQQHIDGVR